MRKRNLLGAAAFSLALAGGGVAGATLGTPGVSGAQDGTTAPSTATTHDPSTSEPVHARPGRPGVRFELKTAAEALGMTPAELLGELKEGKSVAEVAEAKGVALSDVTDAMVTAGTERLQELIDRLPERVADGVQRKGLPERPGGGPRGMGGHARPGEAPTGEEAPAHDAN